MNRLACEFESTTGGLSGADGGHQTVADRSGAFLVSLGTFMLVTLVPGNPEVEILGSNASAEDYVRVRSELGLDKPWLQRYGTWLGKVMQGDLGKNVLPPVEEVKTKLMRAFPVSLQLATMAIGFALVVSIPAAMIAAYRPGSAFDRAISSAASRSSPFLHFVGNPAQIGVRSELEMVTRQSLGET